MLCWTSVCWSVKEIEFMLLESEGNRGVSAVELFPSANGQRQPNAASKFPAFKYPSPSLSANAKNLPTSEGSIKNLQRDRNQSINLGKKIDQEGKMASIGNGKPNAEGQPPQPERQAPRLLPPAEVPPPHTEARRVVLLDLLRRRVDGFPTWMVPRYVVHGVDLYGFHPDDLLRRHPPATSPDGKRASYFLNLVRPLTARDPRRSRVVPGGFWKSERAPVPVEAAPGRIVGTNQGFSFISREGEDKDGVRAGFVMYELLLPDQAGRLAGGDELALSTIYPSPRVAKKRSQGRGSTASATRTAAASSAPAPTSSAPLLHRSSDASGSPRSSRAASSPPPLYQAPASSAPPSLEAQAPASSQQPIQGPAFSPPQPPPRQGGAKRVLLLEVGDSPPREGKNFSCHQVYHAMEVLGPGRRVPIECDDLFLLDSGKGKRQRTAAEF